MTEKGSRHTGHSKPGEAGALGLTAWELLEELLVVVEEVEMDGVAEIAGPVGVGESVRSMVMLSWPEFPASGELLTGLDDSSVTTTS